MVFSNTILSITLLVHTFQSHATIASPSLQRRDPALETSPSINYAPVRGDCPANFAVSQPSEVRGLLIRSLHKHLSLSPRLRLIERHLLLIYLLGFLQNILLLGSNQSCRTNLRVRENREIDPVMDRIFVTLEYLRSRSQCFPLQSQRSGWKSSRDSTQLWFCYQWWRCACSLRRGLHPGSHGRT